MLALDLTRLLAGFSSGLWDRFMEDVGIFDVHVNKCTVLKSDNETHYATPSKTKEFMAGMIKVTLLWTSWTPWTEVCSLESDTRDMT